MGVRTITEHGRIVGFQALVGAGGPGRTKYVPVAGLGELKAYRRAKRIAARMHAEHDPGPVRAGRGRNVGGIAGLRITIVPSANGGGFAHIVADGRWHKGRRKWRQASVAKHGWLGALRMVRPFFERRRGAVDLTDKQLLARLARPDLERQR